MNKGTKNPHTLEWNKKISDSHKSLGEKHWSKRPEVKKKMSKTWFVKGQRAWNEGLPAPWAKGFIKGSIPWNKGKKLKYMSDERHHQWKGNKVGYSGLHAWVKRKIGKSEKCLNCGILKKDCKYIHLANISGKYKRDITDWIYLCVKCHWKLDRKSRLLSLRSTVGNRKQKKHVKR